MLPSESMNHTWWSLILSLMHKNLCLIAQEMRSVVLLYHGDLKTLEQIMQVPGIDPFSSVGYLQAKAKQKEQSGGPLACSSSMGKYQNIFIEPQQGQIVQSVERQQNCADESEPAILLLIRLAEYFEKQLNN
jgi:hypothetical protein